MKHTLSAKLSFARFITLGTLFILLGFSLSQKPVVAQQKADYTIKRYKEVKNYKTFKTTYIFDKPVLKGNSDAIKKINQSLEKAYQKSLDHKEAIKTGGIEMNKHGSKWTYPLYSTDKCKVTYNQNGIISFRYCSEWYAGGVHNGYHYGLSYNLKTGKKLQLSDVISGSVAQIKTKISEKFSKKNANKKSILKTPLSDWFFYLKNGKVIISTGAYTPWCGNGETRIRLKGTY